MFRVEFLNVLFQQSRFGLNISSPATSTRAKSKHLCLLHKTEF
jgi:hypothetical protein